MSIELAKSLYATERSHALSALQLDRAALDYAEANEIEDPKKFAFNGTFSLSVHYLLGLGLELMLKAAVVACDENVDAKYLQDKIRHDLIGALDEAEARGFHSAAPNLRELIGYLGEPYKKHWFRYERPEGMFLPDDFDQVQAILKILDDELMARLG
jgi:hypothetical protein